MIKYTPLKPETIGQMQRDANAWLRDAKLSGNFDPRHDLGCHVLALIDELEKLKWAVQAFGQVNREHLRNLVDLTLP